MDIKEERAIDEGEERLRLTKVSKGQWKFVWSDLQHLSLVNYSLAVMVVLIITVVLFLFVFIPWRWRHTCVFENRRGFAWTD